MTNTAVRVLTAACSLSIDAGIPRFDLSKSDYRLGIHGIFQFPPIVDVKERKISSEFLELKTLHEPQIFTSACSQKP
jgi:hypothetical protein